MHGGLRWKKKDHIVHLQARLQATARRQKLRWWGYNILRFCKFWTMWYHVGCNSGTWPCKRLLAVAQWPSIRRGICIDRYAVNVHSDTGWPNDFSPISEDDLPLDCRNITHKRQPFLISDFLLFCTVAITFNNQSTNKYYIILPTKTQKQKTHYNKWKVNVRSIQSS